MSEERPASCIYFGRVVHRRMRPVPHRFQYRVWSLFADLDELPELAPFLPEAEAIEAETLEGVTSFDPDAPDSEDADDKTEL